MNNFESNFGKNELIDTREVFKESEPKVISAFTPENANEAKSEFLENDNLSQPNNKYEKLNSSEIKNLYQNYFRNYSQLISFRYSYIFESLLEPLLVELFACLDLHLHPFFYHQQRHQE